MIILKKNQKQNLALACIAVAIIASLIGYNYSAEKTRQVGFTFGNDLFAIQQDLKVYQEQFSSTTALWKEGDISDEQIDEFARQHFEKMDELIARYGVLRPPASFASSVDLFKLSAESQLQSDKEYVLWMQTGDEQYLVRSDALIQESFAYDTAGLGAFNRAKQGIT